MDAIAGSTSTTTSTPASTATRANSPVRSNRPRITPQMVVFALLVVGIIGSVVYVYLDTYLSGGIKDIGNGFKQVDLKTMVTFSFDQTSGTIEHVPKKWRALDGQKVVLHGELLNMANAGDGALSTFELVYSISECCYTGPPQIQHFIKCTVEPGRKVFHHPKLVKVTGTLHVDVKRDPETNKVTQVYAMDVASVEPVR